MHKCQTVDQPFPKNSTSAHLFLKQHHWSSQDWPLLLKLQKATIYHRNTCQPKRADREKRAYVLTLVSSATTTGIYLQHVTVQQAPANGLNAML